MTIRAQIRELKDMTVSQLRKKYREVYGEDTNARHKAWLFKKIAWRIQELKYGGVSERAKQRALEMANEADLRSRPPKGWKEELEKQLTDTSDEYYMSETKSKQKTQIDPRLPATGSQIAKNYKGRTIVVTVSGPREFQFEGKIYSSLSAIAREITGSSYNGFLFFGLNKKV